MGGCWRGAGRPGFGVQRVEGPGMKAAGDQMWKESPGTAEDSMVTPSSRLQGPLRLVWMRMVNVGTQHLHPIPGPSCLVTRPLAIGAVGQPANG